MSCTTAAQYVGSRPIISMTFHNNDDILDDPTSITIRVKDPAGAVAQYATPHAAISNLSVGVWEFQFPAALTLVGKYWVHVVGSGGGVDVASEIYVDIKGVHVPAA